MSQRLKEASMSASASPASALPPVPLFARLVAWLRDKAAARRAGFELDACASEADRIAQDIGLSVAELRKLANHAPREAKLLNRRMATLQLDPQDLARRGDGVLQDLQRLCTQCASQRKCARALERQPDNPEWQRYCPNAGTLSVLQARWPSAAA
jgi:hypothetical protein